MKIEYGSKISKAGVTYTVDHIEKVEVVIKDAYVDNWLVDREYITAWVVAIEEGSSIPVILELNLGDDDAPNWRK